MEENPRIYSAFESEFKVRPDDIDMNNHVHSSRYFDYILAARYDQMEKDYRMPMEKFIERGYAWVINTAFIQYKRPLLLGDTFTVKTCIRELKQKGIKITFEITRKENGKLCSDGWIDYTMINIRTARAETIPQDIMEQYSI